MEPERERNQFQTKKRTKNGLIQINIYALNGRDFLRITFADNNNYTKGRRKEGERETKKNEEENRFLLHLSHFKKRFTLQMPWIMFGKRERAHGK